MEPDEPARILVIGAGAIGAFYGGMLARTGAEVSVVRRSDAELVESRGFDIATPLGAFVFRPSRVLRSARDRAQAPDYVLLAVKTVRGLDRAALLRDTVGPGTVIALFGNGIGIQEIADAFPEHELISVLAFVAVSRSGATAISHHALGGSRWEILRAAFPPPPNAWRRCLGDLQCETRDDVTAARWLKNLWNIAFNPISVLRGTLDTRAILMPEEGAHSCAA